MSEIQGTERQSNFELMRIIAMVLIVLYHTVRHGNWADGGLFYPDEITFNIVMLHATLPLGKLGVNLFVLLSGYFLVSSTKSTWPKAVKLWLEMLLYSIVLTLGFSIFDGYELTPGNMFAMFTPFISVTWWFATAYLLMLLASPFLNKLLNACSERTHLKLIIGMVIIWSVVPSLFNLHPGYSEFVWFLVLYVIAAYIRLHPIHFTGRARNYLLYGIAVYAVVILLMVLVDITDFRPDIWGVNSYVDVLHGHNNILILAMSVFVFLAFRNFEMKPSRIVNVIAGTMFGVYLLHEFPLMRDYLTHDLFDLYDYTSSPTLILHILMVTAVIMAVGIAVEFIRQTLMDRWLLKGLPDKVLGLQNRFDAWIDRILSKQE